MWRQLLLILHLLLSALSIKVPVDNNEQNATEIIPVNKDQNQKTNVFYISDDANIDSYLIPPDPHKPAEPLPDLVVTPATYLLPPAQERQSEYFNPIDQDEQSDWLPIIQTEKRPDIAYQRKPKSANTYQENSNDANRFVLPIPSTNLEPPSVDAVSEYLTTPEEINTAHHEQNQPLLPENYKLPYPDPNTQIFLPNQQLKSIEPTLALYLTPPKPQLLKTPTNLYPKKFTGGFKPIPIPIVQFAEDSQQEVPKAIPAKYFKPLPITDIDQLTTTDEKKLYHYKKAEHKRKLKGEEVNQPEQLTDGATQETYGGPTSAEQETSETNFRYPGRNAYPAPLRQAPPPAPPRDAGPPAPDGRTEFRMHGMKGPHSYQFGYDTGKGKNRQFRYEERDNDGLVRGHYGYMDKFGKLRVVNYSAHPEYGFHAEEPQENA